MELFTLLALVRTPHLAFTPLPVLTSFRSFLPCHILLLPSIPLPRFKSAVPSNLGSFNLALQGLPAADDYYLLFINSTHGVLYGNSYAFSIVDSATNASAPSLDSTKPTVSVSGGPNPTAVFATTFPASENSAVSAYVMGTGAVGMLGLAVVGMMGGAWAVL